MKKFAVYAVVLILFFLLIVPLFLPSSFEIKRSITVASSPETAFNNVSNFKNWEAWSPWFAQEPSANYTYEGPPGVVGSFSQWDGKKIGSGRQTLVRIIKNEAIETHLQFFKPFESESFGYWDFETIVEGQTKVTWGFRGRLSYPLERYFGLTFESMMGKDFEYGLKHLKDILEKTP